jgi:hypothetical protein
MATLPDLRPLRAALAPDHRQPALRRMGQNLPGPGNDDRGRRPPRSSRYHPAGTHRPRRLRKRSFAVSFRIRRIELPGRRVMMPPLGQPSPDFRPPMQPTPLCPITGLPAIHRIQSISASLLIGLWRWSFGVGTDRQLGNIEHFGLWESPCGLAFFDPMLVGDEAFYHELYRRGDFPQDVECFETPLQR